MVRLRRATAADAEAMADVAERAYTPYLERMQGQRPGPMDEDYAGLVAGTEAWVADDDGAVVGFLVLVDEPGAMLLQGVAVLPEQQGRGIGRDLLVLAEERARAAGHTRIRLYTHRTMVENQRLYERVGYVETHRAQVDGFGRVFFVKELGPS